MTKSNQAVNGHPVTLSGEQDETLIAHGYEPIPVNGKSPVSDGWQDGAVTAERLAAQREAYGFESTGLRTGRAVGLDIDLRDDAHTDALALLAANEFGATMLQRRGSKGRLLVYRNETPCRKITVKGVPPGGDKRVNLIEILGTGQQFVSFGLHPDTGQPYRWLIDDPDGLDGPLTPLTVPLSALPTVTPEGLRIFAAAAVKVLQDLGYTQVAVSGFLDGEDRAASDAAGEPVAASELRSALSAKDKDGKAVFDAGCGRDEYWQIIAAIHAANIPGDDDASERRAIALEYASGALDPTGAYKNKCPDNYKGEADVLKDFDTSPPKAGGVGVGTIFGKAKAAGWNGNPHNDGIPAAEKFKEYTDKLNANEGAKQNSGKKFVPLDLEQEIKRPAPTFFGPSRLIIKAVEGSVALFTGSKGTHKTGVLMTETIGYSIKQKVRVVYALVEMPGDAARARIPAICQHYGVTWRDLKASGCFHLIPDVPSFQSAADVDKFIDDIADLRPDIIVIDTAAHTAVDSMNKDETAMALVRSAKLIARTFRCSVNLIGHLGKDAERGTRGAKALEDGVDLVSYFKTRKEAGGDTVYVTMAHSRVCATGYTVAFDAKAYSGHAEGATDPYTAVPVLAYRSISDGEAPNRVERNAANNLLHIAEVLEDIGATDEASGVTTRKLAEHMVGPLPEGASAAEEDAWETSIGDCEVIASDLTVAKKRRDGKRALPAARGLFKRVGALKAGAKRDTRPLRWFKPKTYQKPASVGAEVDGGDE